MAENVQDYGAAGDGTTDDTQAIRDAADAAGPGGTVYFPSTSDYYLVGSNTDYPLDYPMDGSWDNLTWKGESYDTTQIRMAGGKGNWHMMFRADSGGGYQIPDVTFEQLDMDLNGQNNTNAPGSGWFRIYDGTGTVTMRDCIVRNTIAFGLQFGDAMAGDIRYCEWNTIGTDRSKIVGHAINPNPDSVQSYTIEHCYFVDGSGQAVNLGTDDTGNDWVTVDYNDNYKERGYGGAKLSTEASQLNVRRSQFVGDPGKSTRWIKSNSPETPDCGGVLLDNVYFETDEGSGIDLACDGGHPSVEIYQVALVDVSNAGLRTFAGTDGKGVTLYDCDITATDMSVHDVNGGAGAAVFFDSDCTGSFDTISHDTTAELGTTNSVTVGTNDAGGSQLSPTVVSKSETGPRSTTSVVGEQPETTASATMSASESITKSSGASTLDPAKAGEARAGVTSAGSSGDVTTAKMTATATVSATESVSTPVSESGSITGSGVASAIDTAVASDVPSLTASTPMRALIGIPTESHVTVGQAKVGENNAPRLVNVSAALTANAATNIIESFSEGANGPEVTVGRAKVGEKNAPLVRASSASATADARPSIARWDTYGNNYGESRSKEIATGFETSSVTAAIASVLNDLTGFFESGSVTADATSYVGGYGSGYGSDYEDGGEVAYAFDAADATAEGKFSTTSAGRASDSMSITPTILQLIRERHIAIGRISTTYDVFVSVAQWPSYGDGYGSSDDETAYAYESPSETAIVSQSIIDTGDLFGTITMTTASPMDIADVGSAVEASSETYTVTTVAQELSGYIESGSVSVDAAAYIGGYGSQYGSDYEDGGEVAYAFENPSVTTDSPLVADDAGLAAEISDVLVRTLFDVTDILIAIESPSQITEMLPELVETGAAFESPAVTSPFDATAVGRGLATEQSSFTTLLQSVFIDDALGQVAARLTADAAAYIGGYGSQYGSDYEDGGEVAYAYEQPSVEPDTLFDAIDTSLAFEDGVLTATHEFTFAERHLAPEFASITADAFPSIGGYGNGYGDQYGGPGETAFASEYSITVHETLFDFADIGQAFEQPSQTARFVVIGDELVIYTIGDHVVIVGEPPEPVVYPMGDEVTYLLNDGEIRYFTKDYIRQ